MKTSSLVGIALIIIGVLIFAYQGFTYTTQEKAVDLGPIQITAEKTHAVHLPRIIGAASIVGGLVVLVLGSRKG
jgi:uncharacterized membrane protein